MDSFHIPHSTFRQCFLFSNPNTYSTHGIRLSYHILLWNNISIAILGSFVFTSAWHQIHVHELWRELKSNIKRGTVWTLRIVNEYEYKYDNILTKYIENMNECLDWFFILQKICFSFRSFTGIFTFTYSFVLTKMKIYLLLWVLAMSNARFHICHKVLPFHVFLGSAVPQKFKIPNTNWRRKHLDPTSNVRFFLLILGRI